MGLGVLLHSLPSVRTRAEDRVDYKYEDYSEEKGRIRIRTHSLLFEKDLIPDVTLQGALVRIVVRKFAQIQAMSAIFEEVR